MERKRNLVDRISQRTEEMGMKIVCKSGGMKNIVNAGFENTLLNFPAFCSPRELEHYGEDAVLKKIKEKPEEKSRLLISEHPMELYNSIKPLLSQYKKLNLRTPIAQAPYLLRSTARTDLGGLLVQLTRESIKCCGQEGCPYIIVKPLFSGIKRNDEWKANREFYLSLADTAKRNHVMILLENQCKDFNGHLTRGICSEAEETRLWIDRLNTEAGEERFGFCMDVGVCSLCGQNTQEVVLKLGKRLKAVILRDCNGHCESSLLPFFSANQGQSQTDWLGLIRGLREIGFDGQMVMDIGDSVNAFPFSLRAEIMKLAKSVADYFKWQIEMETVLKRYSSIVLFGAGNMCRNYMKCYGEKYPPLFTCDNNRRIWGTDFCGLKVESPERLKKLPEDCAILICNIYYKDILDQLLAMGVENPIEYFNDEYMPSYYFDRLEMSRLEFMEK